MKAKMLINGLAGMAIAITTAQAAEIPTNTTFAIGVKKGSAGATGAYANYLISKNQLVCVTDVRYDKINSDTSISSAGITVGLPIIKSVVASVGLGAFESRYNKKITEYDMNQIASTKIKRSSTISSAAIIDFKLLQKIDINMYLHNNNNFSIRSSADLYSKQTEYGMLSFKLNADSNTIDGKSYQTFGAGAEINF